MMDLPPVDLVPVTAECVSHAATSYDVHPDILYALLMVEGGAVGKDANANINGTKDIGPAQINSVHLDELRALGITEDELRNNGCLNIYVQARYLSQVLSEVDALESEQDYLYAIARYHSKDKSVAQHYVIKLKKAFRMMYTAQPTASQ